MKARPFSTVVLLSLTACGFLTQSQQPIQSEQAAQPNLVALFLVKRNNLTNEFRGEVYPIALYLNNRYVDVSTDVTQQLRDDFDPERVVQINQSRSMLTAIRAFTAVKDEKELGQLTVDQLRIGQFSCTSMLVGEGEFAGQSLPSLFDSLPDSRTENFEGSIGKQRFDETWRWLIATSQHTPVSAVPTTAVDEARLKADLLSAAENAIAQDQSVAATAETTVQMSLFDLNHDGKPEIFGTLRRGDPTASPPQGTQPEPTVYVNLWLSYQNGKPTLLSSQVTSYQIPVDRSPYDVAGTLDVSGDGISEVLMRYHGYESTSFKIYEWKGNRLEEVFQGAGYGC